MSDDNDNQRTRKPLGLKRSVDAGEVKQTFSHGRTNKVVVEVKRRRVLGKPGEAAPSAPTPLAVLPPVAVPEPLAIVRPTPVALATPADEPAPELPPLSAAGRRARVTDALEFEVESVPETLNAAGSNAPDVQAKLPIPTPTDLELLSTLMVLKLLSSELESAPIAAAPDSVVAVDLILGLTPEMVLTPIPT